MFQSDREWRFYLDDMAGFAGKVLTYTQGLDQTGFEADTLVYDATMRNLELIGEAATHIPDSVRKSIARGVAARHPRAATMPTRG